MSKFNYPTARRSDRIDKHCLQHEIKVPNPYQWMENPNDDETKKFVMEQNSITRPYIDTYPYRQIINDRMKEVWNYPKYSCVYKHGSKYFYYHNPGLLNQSVLYVVDTLSGTPEVFFDPNELSADGTVSLSSTKFSEDGSIFAYGLSESGSDWLSIHFKNVSTGEKYSDILTKIKFSSIAWTHDSKGIFYSRYGHDDDSLDKTLINLNQKLYYHKLGTDEKDDVVIAEFPDKPGIRIGAEVSDDGRWLILTPVKGCKNNLVYFADLSSIKEINGKIPLTPMVTELTHDYEYVTNVGTKAVFKTNKNATKYELILVDFLDPREEKWETLIPEHSRDVLDWASPINTNQLVVCYIQDVKSVLHLYNVETGKMICDITENLFPGGGSVNGFGGKKTHTEFFFSFSSYIHPGIVYHVDLTKPKCTPTVYKEVRIPGKHPKFSCEQHFYKSRDGTKIPLFLVWMGAKKPKSNSPCLLYGYGGFNVSIMPGFNITRLMFMEMYDGYCAIANIRGGGEYGDNWHNGGRFEMKQNTFNDFQDAAKYLIENGFTSSDRLIIQGASNGGLLVGACINQAPELFQAAIAQVGVMDMLNYKRFTIGHAWVSDYGDPDELEKFQILHKYSPVHNVKPRNDCQYPATLLLTADHDDRVVPMHSLKFIAELQHQLGDKENQINPLMIRVETDAGHGMGKPTTKQIDESVDILSFIGKACGLTVHVPDSNIGDHLDKKPSEESKLDQ